MTESKEKETSSSNLTKVQDLSSDVGLHTSLIGIEGESESGKVEFLPFFQIHADIDIQNEEKTDNTFTENNRDHFFKTIFEQVEVLNHPALFIRKAEKIQPYKGNKFNVIAVVPDRYVIERIRNEDNVFIEILKEGEMPVAWRYQLYFDTYHIQRRCGLNSLALDQEYDTYPPTLTGYLQTPDLLFLEEDRDYIRLPITNNNEEVKYSERIGKELPHRRSFHYLPQFKDI